MLHFTRGFKEVKCVILAFARVTWVTTVTRMTIVTVVFRVTGVTRVTVWETRVIRVPQIRNIT